MHGYGCVDARIAALLATASQPLYLRASVNQPSIDRSGSRPLAGWTSRGRPPGHTPAPESPDSQTRPVRGRARPMRGSAGPPCPT
eukprot:4535112-Prymnesium_polylepis.1